jgi:hypothetical protein
MRYPVDRLDPALLVARGDIDIDVCAGRERGGDLNVLGCLAKAINAVVVLPFRRMSFIVGSGRPNISKYDAMSLAA